MFTARFRLALASTCTSLLLAAAAPAQSPADPTQTAVELELELARSRDLYLVVDPGARRLEVRARGMALDSMPLGEVTVQALVPLVGTARRPRLELPAVWHVTEAPEDDWRRVIAPPTLRPYTEEEEEEPTPTAGPGGPRPTPAPTATPVEVPPDYSLGVDSGWRLEVATESPGGPGARLAGAVASGWKRLWGERPDSPPPRLVLVLTPDDARRLRHLFVPGMAILMVSTSPSAEPA